MLALLRRAVVGFSEGKKTYQNTQQYLKMRKNAIQQAQSATKATPQQLAQAHKMLYVQYIPLPFFAFPMLYFSQDPTSMLLLQSCNAVQYYASGLLCYNAFFTQKSPKKYLGFITTVSLLNCLSGQLGCITPLALGLLNLIAPITNQQLHLMNTQEQNQRVKTYLKVTGVYYFVVMVLITLKGYHFVELREMEKKIKGYQIENQAYFKSKQ